ncbi:MAG TPA: DUF4386 domain-containing protein [Rudaea sp.]|nr:DUF4386 domain-containing protein [Rudaea sp.]
MTARDFSPQTYARVAGFLYLVNIVAGLLGEAFVRDGTIVAGDAAATAANIVHSPGLWRMGVAGDLLMHITDVPMMMIYYVLFKPVNRRLALMAMLFTLVQSATLVATKLNQLLPLFLLSDAAYLKAFSPEQAQALAYVAIRADAHGFGIGLIFFGCACLTTGHLIRRSDFLPKLLGVGLQIAGICYLVNSFALILAPDIEGMLFPAILMPCFVAESALCLWLLVKGIDAAKWRAWSPA